jgi:hypothetical protein
MVADRVMPAYGAPDVVRAMIPSGIRVVETVSWAPAATDGSRTAAIRVDFPHHPLTLRGTLSLVGAGDSTRVTVAGRLRAAVPFVAGRIERMAAKLVVQESRSSMASAATGSPESTASTEEVAVSSQPVRGSAWRRAVGTLALAVLLTACTATHEGQGHRAGPGSAAGPSSPSSDTAQPSCPASYVPPRADRPRVALTFAVAPDLATVRGTERITFTPDRSVTELVFDYREHRTDSGNRHQIVVASAQADPAAGDATFSPDGADPSTQGGHLPHIPFRRQLLRAPK